MHVVRIHAVGGIALHIDALDAAAVHEVVDIGAAPGRVEIAVDGRRRETVGSCLEVVDVEAHLRDIIQGRGVRIEEFRAVSGHGQKFRPGFDEGVVSERSLVFQFHGNARGLSEAAHLRRLQENDARLVVVREAGSGTAYDGSGALLRIRAFVPGLQAHVARSNVLPSGAVGSEAEHDGQVIHAVSFPVHDVVLDFRADTARVLTRGPRRQEDVHEEGTLIFDGKERGRHGAQGPDTGRDDKDIHGHDEAAVMRPCPHGPAVPVRGGVHEAVEPSERTCSPACAVFPEESRAHGRRDHVGHEDGENHGRYNGQGKLAVDGARHAAEKGHGQEDG